MRQTKSETFCHFSQKNFCAAPSDAPAAGKNRPRACLQRGAGRGRRPAAGNFFPFCVPLLPRRRISCTIETITKDKGAGTVGSVLIHTGQEPVSLSAQELQRLLDGGDGDAALLYLALLRRRGAVQPRALARELRWDRQRIEAAEEKLRQMQLLAMEVKEVPEPPQEPLVYQPSDIAQRLEDSGEFRTLTAEVEKKMGRRLTSAEVGVLLGLQDDLGLPGDVIYLLVGHCIQTAAQRYGPGRRPTLRQIEREGYAWAKLGIDTQAQAVEHLKRYALRQECLPRYLAALGIRERSAAPSEEKYLSAWQEMGFPPETVALAYDKTVLKCREFRWAYCNGILKRWHEAGLHTPEQVRQERRAAPERRPPDSGGGAWKYV